MADKIKQKMLLPTLREKRRYLVYEVISDVKINYKDAKDAVVSSFKDLFGLNGLAIAGLDFIEYDNNKGVLRVSTKGLDMIRASFCFVRKINKDDVVLRSLGVSGMLNKSRTKFVGGGY